MNKSIFHGLNANKLVLILSDFFMSFFVFFLSVLCIPFLYDSFNSASFLLDFPVHFLIYGFTLYLSLLAVGLYNEKLDESYSEYSIRIIIAISISYVLLTLLNKFFYRPLYIEGLNEVLALNSILLITLSRLIIIRFNLNALFKRNVLVLGTEKKTKIISHYLKSESDYIGLNIIGFWSISNKEESFLNKKSINKKSQSLIEFAKKNKIDEIVIANDKHNKNLPYKDLFTLKKKGIVLTDILDFIERETGQVAIDQLSLTSFNNTKKNKYGSFFYSLFNIFIAIFIGLLTLPVMIITAIAIKIEGGRKFPILYSQERIGLAEKTFSIYKFTSMKVDAEKNGAQWAQKNDPRVTKVGKFIRKFRIDELPQLYNVLVGDMFFVGPRPERPQFTEGFQSTIPFYSQRHNVKPGLTGWAQLKYPYGSSEKDALEKLKFDLYYVKKKNFFLDLLILLRTSEIILFGKGR